MTTQTFDIKAFLAGVDLAGMLGAEWRDAFDTGKGRTPERPCPFCGGKTRAWLWVGHDGIERLTCSHCERQGLDAIGYVIRRDNLRDTMERGRDGKAYPLSAHRQAIRILRGNAMTPARQIERKPTPAAEIGPPFAAWQSHARAFAEACAAALWQPAGARALAYLRGRGLSDGMIRRYRLGYHAGGRLAGVWAERGITIPREIGGAMWAVNVRRPIQGKDKYKCIAGSRLGLFNADALTGARVVLALGGELDCILAAQHAPDGLAPVTFGGEGHSLNEPWRMMVAAVPVVRVALDNDERGDGGAVNWSHLPQSRRARVPGGAKDLTDYGRAGGNVAAWLREIVGTPTAPALIDVCTWSEYLARQQAANPTDDTLGAFDWPDDYLAGMLGMLTRNGYAPRLTPAGGIVCEREGVGL